MNATPGNNKSSRKTKKDAFQQTNLENSSPTKSRRIHQHHREKRDNQNLFSSRTPRRPITTKTSHSSFKKGKRKEETSKTKETYHKDDKGLPPSKNKPPFFQKVKQKEEEPASPKHFLFIQGSPITQVALNRWYKNERSPRNTHLDITPPKRNISLETS